MTLPSGLIIFAIIIVVGFVPFSVFLALALIQPVCWSDNLVNSQTWLIIFSVDWLGCFTVMLGIWLYSLFFSGKTFGSGNSFNWYWTSALIWLFDIGWLATLSYQINHFGFDNCNSSVVIAALVLLCIKLLWTPFQLFFVCMGG